MNNWNDDTRDWLHGDDLHAKEELEDSYQFEPMQKWEIDAAIESLKAKAMYHAGANHD
tara:strand:- start:209 stop:382 length:174 start_codon:yes stop_codon:yes gene_type:complete